MSRDGHVRVEFTPTFLGCPALEAMKRALEETVRRSAPSRTCSVIQDDSWSTDKITPAGREKLRAAGFAPPRAARGRRAEARAAAGERAPLPVLRLDATRRSRTSSARRRAARSATARAAGSRSSSSRRSRAAAPRGSRPDMPCSRLAQGGTLRMSGLRQRSSRPLLSALGLAYACLWWSFERFYGEFGVSPQDVGLAPSGTASDMNRRGAPAGVWLVVVIVVLATRAGRSTARARREMRQHGGR